MRKVILVARVKLINSWRSNPVLTTCLAIWGFGIAVALFGTAFGSVITPETIYNATSGVLGSKPPVHIEAITTFHSEYSIAGSREAAELGTPQPPTRRRIAQ